MNEVTVVGIRWASVLVNTEEHDSSEQGSVVTRGSAGGVCARTRLELTSPAHFLSAPCIPENARITVLTPKVPSFGIHHTQKYY